MSLALRCRLPVLVCCEYGSTYSYLGNVLLKRQYVTPSDQATKKTCPPIPPPDIRETKDQIKNALDSSASKTMPKKESIPKLQEITKKDIKEKYSPKQVRENVQVYAFVRFYDMVKNYDKVLEKNFPSAMKVYRVFFDGVKDFFVDMKRFLKISRIIKDSPKGLQSLNRQELELYMQMPKDMVKVAPALIFSSLPMVGYAIFPLVLMYPRNFLTSHFWTLQQKSEFQQYYFHERLLYNRQVFRCLQSKLKTVRKHPKYEDFGQVLGQLGSGTHPSVEQVLNIKEIFAEEPYNLVSLPGKHIKLLNKMHGIPSGWFNRHRLHEHAFLVHYMDKAIIREGGVHNMPLNALRNACYIRGLYPANLSNDEMIQWLRNWIKISTTIESEHVTLFLHLPLFLGYNAPNNWQLVHGKDKKK